MSETAPCPNCSTPLPPSGDCPNCATQAFSTPRPGELKISGYDILGRIGEGGMGAIYLAEEKSLGRRVAIKVISGTLSAEPQARARFMREARSLATVEHPNVVRVYSFGEVEGHPYLAMEYVDGETLAERIRRSGAIATDEAMRILRQILQALEAAWEKGIVHRDIKPSNVLIDRRGQVHVVDFGLAKTKEVAGDGALTQAGSVLGTPYYLAPEQAQGDAADFRADIYSCGILLYEMLAGVRPFEGTSPVAIVAKQIHEPLPSIRATRKDVPNRIVRLLEQMTQKQPSARAASYAELLSVIDALLGITPAKAITGTQTFSTIPIDQRARTTRTAALIAATIAILIIAALVFRDRFAKPTASTTMASEGRFVVAVAPFYGPDAESEREGRLMAAMVERSIQTRLGEHNVRVIGIDETKTPVRHNDAARLLGERMNAGVVVWGEAFALRNETEIQPHFTIIQRAKPVQAEKDKGADLVRAEMKEADPTASLEAKAAPVMRLETQAPNQIQLRKTSADGVGEIISLLAAVNALYTERAPRKALAFLDQAPRSADTLRYRAEAHLQLADNDKAASALEEVLKLEPNDAVSHARLADLDSLAGKAASATLHYKAAAASGQSSTSRYGIYSDGLLYQRDTFRGTGKTEDSGYLLAVDPATGVVVHRYRMPGIIQSFSPASDGFKIAYIFRERDTARGSLTFRKGQFDQPLLYAGGNLLLRMRAMKSGWVLPQNFMDEFASIPDKQPVRPFFRVNKDPKPEAPASLPPLESALRAAMERDPTQPWHLFFLGQTLFAEGRTAEANAAWSLMLSRDFTVPYTNWAWMAKYFERLRQSEWADRTWEKAVRERQRIPQPIAFTTLIERLINVPVMRLHPSQLADPERAYLWLVRARSLSGMTEGDHLAAAAWMKHFERHGDARAVSERRFLKIAQTHPFNFTAKAVELDYALYLWGATWFALFLSLLLLLNIGSDRARVLTQVPRVPLRERIRSGPLWWVASEAGPAGLSRVARRLRAVLLALASAAAVYVAIRVRILIESSAMSGRMLIGIIGSLLILLMFLFVLAHLSRARQIIAMLRSNDRAALVLAFLVCLITSWLAIRTVNQHLAFATLPIGLADSMGHSQIVADFEDRLAKRPSPELRYCAAVANDYAGKTGRATELYRELPDDPRARKALAAMEKGRSSPSMPPAAEIYRAFSAGYPKLHMGDTRSVDVAPLFTYAFNILGRGTLALAGMLLVAFLFVPPSSTATPLEPSARSRRRPGKFWLMVLPGAYDLRYRSPLRGTLMLMLTAMAGCFAFSCWAAFRIPGTIGVMSSVALPNYRASFPLPPDMRASDLYLAIPYAHAFYATAIGSLLGLIVLHASRLKAIWKL